MRDAQILGIPEKLIKLIEMTMKDWKTAVITKGEVSEELGIDKEERRGGRLICSGI